MIFHRAARNHLLLVYPREVLILDLDLGQTVGIIGLDRGSPSIVEAFSASRRDAVFILKECGTVSVRRRRKLYALSTLTPALPKSFSFSDAGSVDGGLVNVNSDSVMEIGYEPVAAGETLRLGKNAKILGMACNPMTEREVVTVTTDGKVIFQELLPAAAAGIESQYSNLREFFFCRENLFPQVISNAEKIKSIIYLIKWG